MNQTAGKAEGEANAGAAQAADRKRRAQQQAASIQEQVREKLKEHYEGTT
jgi:hypothetical protein